METLELIAARPCGVFWLMLMWLGVICAVYLAASLAFHIIEWLCDVRNRLRAIEENTGRLCEKLKAKKGTE